MLMECRRVAVDGIAPLLGVYFVCFVYLPSSGHTCLNTGLITFILSHSGQINVSIAGIKCITMTLKMDCLYTIFDKSLRLYNKRSRATADSPASEVGYEFKMTFLCGKGGVGFFFLSNIVITDLW